MMDHKVIKLANDITSYVSNMSWILFNSRVVEANETTSMAIVKGNGEDKTTIDFKEFWNLKHIRITTQELEDRVFLKTYQKTITRDIEAGYKVLFPFKDNRRTMEKNKNNAIVRLLGLLKRMMGGQHTDNKTGKQEKVQQDIREISGIRLHRNHR